MRNISFSMTTPQFILGEKDVTRRFSWWDLQPQTKLMGVEKAMGLKKGEAMNRLGVILVVKATTEPLDAMIKDPEYGAEEMRREGYPFGMTDPAEFVHHMAKLAKKPIDAPVRRIEFKKEFPCAGCGLPMYGEHPHYRHCCSHSCARDFYN